MTAAGQRGGTVRGEERKAAVLDAARARLVGGGWGAVTMRQIASDAGVALGHLQYYFPTLPELVRALLTREIESGRRRIEAALQGKVEGGASLDAMIDALLADHDQPELVGLFVQLWASAAHDPAMRAPLADFYEAWRDAVAQDLVDRALAPTRAVARRRADRFLAALEGLSLFRSGIASRERSPSARESRAWLRAILEGG